jgi:hypothetical protein
MHYLFMVFWRSANFLSIYGIYEVSVLQRVTKQPGDLQKYTILSSLCKTDRTKIKKYLILYTFGICKAKWTVAALFSCALKVDHEGSYAFLLYFCCPL